MFTLKKLVSIFTIVALCLLTWPSPALGQAGADVPPQVLHRPHDVDRLPDGHTLITDGGQHGGAAGAQPERRPFLDGGAVVVALRLLLVCLDLGRVCAIL